MPFYRSNPKSGGGGADYDSFYITVNGQDKYVACSDFVQRVFSHNYTTFNEPITIGNNVGDVSFLIANASKFNSSVIFGSRTRYADNMALKCYNFNQPITFGSVVSCRNTFCNCYNLNQPMVINGELLQEADSMFANCNNFNQPINITFNKERPFANLQNMFRGCTNLNSPITMVNGNNINAYFMFFGSNNINAPVNVGTCGIFNGSYMFSNCNTLNSAINIGIDYSTKNNYADFNFCFISCLMLNNIVSFVDYGDYSDANYRVNMGSMFAGCHNFNKPFVFPNHAYAINNCFSQCTRFNQDVIIPDKVWSGENLFYNCTNFGANVYFKGNVARPLYLAGLFRNCNKAKRKTIWCHPNLTNYFLGSGAGSVAGVAVTWTTTTNGYYNSTQNIYIYNNYEG